MRRTALLGLMLLLPGCSYVGNPFANFTDFVGDTHTVRLNPNRPVGHSENLLRVMGRPVSAEPLAPEPGDIWPGPQPPDITLEDIQRQQNQESLQPSMQPPESPITRGSSTPPPPMPPASRPMPPSFAPTPPPPAQRAPRSNVVPTPQGPAVITPGGSGITTYAAPGGGTGLAVPNDNGTTTLIGPDGSVQTVPSPR